MEQHKNDPKTRLLTDDAQRLHWEAEMNDALADLANALVSSVSLEDLAAKVLEHGRRLTGSKFGYCGYIDPQTGYLVSPTLSRDIWDVCLIADKTVVFEKFTGLFGWVLKNKQSICTNEPDLDPRSAGVPDGHLPIKRFLSVPAMVRGKLVGQLALANSHRDYTRRDLEFVQRLTYYYALAVERKWDEQRLDQINKLNVAVLNSLTSHLAVLDNKGDIIAVNEAWKKFARANGADSATLLAKGQNYLEVCWQGAKGGCQMSARAWSGISAVLEGVSDKFSLEYPCHGRCEKRWFLLNVNPLLNGGGAVISHTDITKRKKNEARQKAELEVLSELANFEDLKHSIDNVLKILIKEMGCQAAAIRLADGHDFTYFAHTGYTDGFIDQETSLCSARTGPVVGNVTEGEPVLECLCGKVLNNALIDMIHREYLTDYGSFVTGSLNKMKDDAFGPLQLPGPWRLTCLEVGFETLVLVPIKDEKINIGLLQLNGRHENQVGQEDMAFLELISRHIASAVNHLKDAAALKESEERYRRLAENAPDVIYRINLVPRLKYEYISLAVETLTGYTPGQYYLDPDMYYRLVFPADKGKLASILKESNRGNPVEMRWVRRDGQIIWIEQRNMLIKDKTGQVVAMEGIARDITERKRIELNRQKQALYDRVMAGAMAILTGYDKRSEVLKKLIELLTKRFGYQMGVYYSYDEWINSFHCLVYRPLTVNNTLVPLYLADQAIIDAAFDLCTVVLPVSGHGVTDVKTVRVAFPVHYQRMIKGVLIIEASRNIEKDEISFLEKIALQLGITLHGIKQFEDLKLLSSELADRQREIEGKNQELEYANKAKNEFLTNMSHELRTPLNSVIGFSELLERQLFGPLNQRQLEYVHDIKESGEHLLALINDILDLSKVEAGAMELDLEEVFLPDLLESCVRLLRERAMQKNIELLVDINDQVGLVVVDARKIKQVVFNLLSNAIKFTPGGGRVHLTAGLNQQLVTVSIKDSGIGISETDQQKIFMAFAQVDGSLTRRHEGTGLGLALSKKLVRMHGGDIKVSSQLGVGSEFKFSIPEQAEASPAGAVDMSQSAGDIGGLAEGRPYRGPLVLVVEDDEGDAHLMESVLNQGGYRVVRAVNCAQGLEMARKLYPQMIILDAMIPPQSGWGLLEMLRLDRELKNIPVLLIALAGDVQKGLTQGAARVLARPFNMEQLAMAIQGTISPLTEAAQPAPTILVIDDDPKAVEIIADLLAGWGYRIIRAYGGAEGIQRAQQEKVDLIILDLMMPEVDGFAVIKKMQSDAGLKKIPVIIITAKRLTRGDMEKVEGLVYYIKEKGDFSPAMLLKEVRKVLGGTDTGKEIL